ncbi:P1 family peptidase [Paracoccus sp. (in: a-proteobacteria)]|uniref:DmpA family aminopeptidase n=1 Tax=Paracoccus sp. TaxID=267 RepID=UPI0035B2B1FF
MAKQRARDLGLDVPGIPGPLNAITDIPGVEVGVTTLIAGQGPLVVGKGPVRTGVTAILPRGHDDRLIPVWAGIHALNGNGEMTGSHWIRDGGYFLGPILITNTHSVGMAHHAATGWMIEHYPEIKAEHVWAMPVVAETYDGVLNDINGRHLSEEHVRAALDCARGGPVPEGAVGGGTGMIAYEFKGGTGTASRRVGEYTVGVLVQANHGIRDWLTVFGTHVGPHLRDDLLSERERGSIIVVVGTDAPMMPHQIQRLARRAGIGIGRNGTPGGNSSGDIFIAFSTANPIPRAEMETGRLGFEFLSDNDFDPYYLAAVEATEEAVINAMLAGEDFETLKPQGKTCAALRPEALLAAIAKAKAG